MITRLAAFDLEYVEQPVASLADLAAVRRRVDVPIAADECIRSLDDARALRARNAADVIVLKQQPLGGVRAALAVAEAAGVPAVVSSMMETSVGIAAGVALAAALPELPYACGLATLAALPGDVTHAPLAPVDGVLPVRAVVPDADLLARYSVKEASR
jgi:O-succinylbenzoate synthase